jgi:hypothetical protein
MGQYFAPGSTVRLRFNTHKADGTPITLAGTPAVSVYKHGSTTESTSGVSLTVDFDSRTGLHLVAIDTSTDGVFYAADSDFDVVITTGTVDSVSVAGSVVGSFTTKPMPWNAAWDAEVQSECADALTAYDPPTNAELEARTLVAADYATATNLATVAGYLDTEIQTIITNLATVDTVVDAILVDTDATIPALIADLPTAAENAAAMLDLADGIETGLTPRQAMRLFAAALGGVLSGAGTTTITIKGAGVGTTRVTATVDTDGNRSALTLNL